MLLETTSDSLSLIVAKTEEKESFLQLETNDHSNSRSKIFFTDDYQDVLTLLQLDFSGILKNGTVVNEKTFWTVKKDMNVTGVNKYIYVKNVYSTKNCPQGKPCFEFLSHYKKKEKKKKKKNLNLLVTQNTS